MKTFLTALGLALVLQGIAVAEAPVMACNSTPVSELQLLSAAELRKEYVDKVVRRGLLWASYRQAKAAIAEVTTEDCRHCGDRFRVESQEILVAIENCDAMVTRLERVMRAKHVKIPTDIPQVK